MAQKPKPDSNGGVEFFAPVEPDAHPNVIGWELTNKGFMPFLSGLLSELWAQLQIDNGEMALTKRFGGDTVASLFDILKKTRI
ncbi:MAG: hypothetical protein V3R37_00895 [Rhodospirillales bacterium]